MSGDADVESKLAEPYPTLEKLEDEKLHLAYASENRAVKRPVELLPFIEFTATPETEKNACYFYDCIGRETVQYVPYAGDVEAKIKKPENTQALIDAISKLKLKTE